MNASQVVLLDDQLLRKILRIHSFILYLVLFEFDNELPPTHEILEFSYFKFRNNNSGPHPQNSRHMSGTRLGAFHTTVTYHVQRVIGDGCQIPIL